jgi:hypothetical protein
MGGGTGHQTSTTTSEPWAEQKPYMIEGMKKAQDLWKQPGPNYYPGSTVAPVSGDTTAGYQAVRDQQTGAGQQGVTAAQNTNTDFLTGKYLNSNPYDDAVFNNIRSKVMPAVSSSAMMAGRSGSDQAGGLAAKQLTDAYAPYAASQYQRGLDNMQQAVGAAPGLNQAGYFGADALMKSGGQQQQDAQSQIDADINKFNWGQNLEQSKLDDYMKMITGTFGGQSGTSTTPYQKPSIWSQVLGGALGLGGLFV